MRPSIVATLRRQGRKTARKLHGTGLVFVFVGCITTVRKVKREKHLKVWSKFLLPARFLQFRFLQTVRNLYDTEIWQALNQNLNQTTS